MGRFDFLANGYTSTIGMAVNKNTDLETGVDLISAARKFTTTYYEEANEGILFTEEDINFFLVDLIANFCDNNVDFDMPCLAKLLVLDKELYRFTLSMQTANGSHSLQWKNMSQEKTKAASTALSIAASYWSVS